MQIPQLGEVIFVGGGGLGQAGYKKSSQVVEHQFSSATVQISRHPEKNKGQGKFQRSKKKTTEEQEKKLQRSKKKNFRGARKKLQRSKTEMLKMPQNRRKKTT